MIILAIKTNGNEKLLAIAYRDNKRVSSEWFCTWNAIPNTLQIYHRNRPIEVTFDSFKACLQFIFKMQFVSQAERVASMQKYDFLDREPKPAIEILQNIFGR